MANICDEKTRETMFRKRLQNRPVYNIDYSYLAKITESYSEADIQKVIEFAIRSMMLEIIETDKERDITTDDILDAVIRFRPYTLQ